MYNPEDFVLYLYFKNDQDQTVSMSISRPKENITETDVRRIMQSVVDNGAIYGAGNTVLVSPVAAKIVRKEYIEFEPTVG